MTTILKTFTNLFTNNTQNNINNTENKLATFINNVENDINEILTVIVNQYLEGNNSLPLQLLDSKVCKDTAIYLANSLEDRLNEFSINDMKILYQKEKAECQNNNSCNQLIENIKYKGKNNNNISKKEICSNIAVFNIRIMNLLGAILLQINPTDNIAISRINTLYRFIKKEDDGLILSIDLCNTEDADKLLNVNGLKEFVNMYMYNLILSNDYVDLIKEYNNIVDILSANLNMTPNKLLIQDVQLFNGEIKKALQEFNDKLTGRTTIEINEANKTNNVDEANENNDKNNKIVNIIEEQKDTIDNQKRQIDELQNEISGLKSNISRKNNESSNKINELESEIKIINEKYQELQQKIKDEEKAEVESLRKEINDLIAKVKKDKVSSNFFTGGDIMDTRDRLKAYIAKYSTQSSTELLKNKLFTLFNDETEFKKIDKTSICGEVIEGVDKQPIDIIVKGNVEIENYLNIYKEMTKYYITSITEMIKMLETELLVITYDENGKIGNIKIRIQNNDELNRVEKLVRSKIAEYINGIHNYYLSAVMELNNYFSKK